MEKPLIVAHRGDSLNAPENTIAAFSLAVQAGADALEFDVQESADGEVFVFHDMYLGRTISGQHLFGSLSSTQIRELDAGSNFSPGFAGEPVPSLFDVLDQWHDRVRFEIELKMPSISLARQVIQSIQEFGIEQSVEITSGHLPLLSHIREWDRGIATGTWFTQKPDWIQSAEYLAQIKSYASLLGLKVVHLSEALLSAASVGFLQQSKFLVYGANLNTVGAITKAAELGLDRLSTDNLSEAVRLLR